MIRLAKPNIPEEAIKRAIEVIRSGNLVQGKYVKEFENSIYNYFNVRNFVVSLGTVDLHFN